MTDQPLVPRLAKQGKEHKWVMTLERGWKNPAPAVRFATRVVEQWRDHANRLHHLHEFGYSASESRQMVWGGEHGSNGVLLYQLLDAQDSTVRASIHCDLKSVDTVEMCVYPTGRPASVFHVSYDAHPAEELLTFVQLVTKETWTRHAQRPVTWMRSVPSTTCCVLL